MKNILVTVDFNKSEEILLNKAVEFAKAFNAKIWLMHIAAPEPFFVGYEVGPQYIRDGRAEELREEHRKLEKYTLEMREKGIVADGLLIQGATIEMVIKESEKLDIDLIIAGHNDHSFLYKAIIGSVSANIIKKSKIPVLTIPLD